MKEDTEIYEELRVQLGSGDGWGLREHSLEKRAMEVAIWERVEVSQIKKGGQIIQAEEEKWVREGGSEFVCLYEVHCESGKLKDAQVVWREVNKNLGLGFHIGWCLSLIAGWKGDSTEPVWSQRGSSKPVVQSRREMPEAQMRVAVGSSSAARRSWRGIAGNPEVSLGRRAGL